MQASTLAQSRGVSSFELRFESLFNPGRGLVFPCDERGQVELDSLSERSRQNYFYARAVVGREYATPAVLHGAAN
jgi:hypothetical protein